MLSAILAYCSLVLIGHNAAVSKVTVKVKARKVRRFDSYVEEQTCKAFFYNNK